MEEIDIVIYRRKPKDFDSRFEVVSCFLEHDGKIVLLHRQDNDTQGDSWGLPAGKMESGETPSKAIVREINEETGIEIQSSKISYFGKVYVRYPSNDFIYHMFHSKLDNQAEIRLNDKEHKNFRWVLPCDALKMNLVKDLDVCIKLFYKIK